MKKLFTILIILMFLTSIQGVAQPNTFQSVGIGGGGALFAPSINPANHSEIYMGCDMSELFHTVNQGGTWSELPFGQIQGGHDSQVQFTNNPLWMYGVDYASVNGIDMVRPLKSTDGGVHWSVIAGNPYPDQPDAGILRLFADYNNPNQIMLADYGTIQFSSNGGVSFHLIHTNNSSGAGNHIAGVFFDGVHIYIGTNDGLIVSNDGGTTFSVMGNTGIAAGEAMLSFAGAKTGSTVRFVCLTSTSVYAGIQYGSDYYGALKGVYTMDNASGAWTSKLDGITINTDYPVFCGMAANSIDTMYLAGGSSSGVPIVMKSVKGGAWAHVFLTNQNQNIQTGWCGAAGDRQWSYAEAPFGFQVCPNDANSVIFTDYGFAHLTTNGGGAWKQLYVNTADQNPVGVNTPTHKKYRGNGLENTSCWQVMWGDSLHVFAGYSDINGIQSDDKGVSWKFMSGINTNSVYRILKHSNNTLYAATSNIHDMFQSTRVYDAQIDAGKGEIYFSIDNGGSFSILHSFGHPVVWIEVDPTNSNRMYASVLNSDAVGVGGIYVTNNLSAGTGSVWTKLTNPTRANGHPFNIHVLKNGDLLVSYSARKPTSGTAFTATSGVFYYTLATSTWSDRSHPNMQWWTKDVVVDPNDATESTWYACVFTGWVTSGINGSGGLFKTIDKGMTWNKVSSEYRVNSCTVNPTNPKEVYYTTETAGLWYSSNATSSTPTFTQVSAYDFRHPVRVFYNPYQKGEIWVSSFGSGLKRGMSGGATGAAEVAALPSLRLYPNPVGSELMVECLDLGSGEMQVSVWDLMGRECLLGKTVIGKGVLRLDTSSLPMGVYFLRIMDGGNRVGASRFVKVE